MLKASFHCIKWEMCLRLRKIQDLCPEGQNMTSVALFCRPRRDMFRSQTEQWGRRHGRRHRSEEARESFVESHWAERENGPKNGYGTKTQEKERRRWPYWGEWRVKSGKSGGKSIFDDCLLWWNVDFFHKISRETNHLWHLRTSNWLNLTDTFRFMVHFHLRTTEGIWLLIKQEL